VFFGDVLANGGRRAHHRYALLVSGRRGPQFNGVVMPGEGIEDGRLIMVQIPCLQIAIELGS
jgi:hypothetical protein